MATAARLALVRCDALCILAHVSSFMINVDNTTARANALNSSFVIPTRHKTYASERFAHDRAAFARLALGSIEPTLNVMCNIRLLAELIKHHVARQMSE